MQVDALAVQLRPRPMAEAADLGVRLVQANARSVWFTCLPVFAVVVAIALSTVEIATWLPSVIIFWLKPWMDRSVLFVLSRAAFGQSTRFSDLWKAQRQVWWGRLLSTLMWRRFSPWRAYTQPVTQLENQRGNARSKRRKQLLRGHNRAAFNLQAVFAHVEVVLTFGLLSFALWFAPEESRSGVLDWLTDSEGMAAQFAMATAYAAVVMLLEPFYVAAGFTMYLNRRVELEAWDVEQEFRRAF